jgi:hypothetical protein
MMKVCLHTHWVPLYWRSRAHSAEVRCEFQSLFQLHLAIIGQEFGSLLLLPYICFVSLPRSADDIAKFLRNVCSCGYRCCTWAIVSPPSLVPYACETPTPNPLRPKLEQLHGPTPSHRAQLAHCWKALRHFTQAASLSLTLCTRYSALAE